MGSKETLFFATQEELIAVIRKIKGVDAVQFVLAGNFDDANPSILEVGEEIQAFQRYLVVRQGKRVNVREIQLRSGGTKYAVDQLYNKDSCVIDTGGLAREGQLIAGRISTLGESEDAIALYDMFAKPLRKAFVKIKSYCVSTFAESMLDNGKRLSQNEKAPLAYDLIR